MLKISLKQGQYVNIGDNIRVVYVGGTGNHGRLMIDAPKGCQNCKEYRRTKSGAQEKILIIRNLRSQKKHRMRSRRFYGMNA